jgi:hypothetical protein
MRCQPSRPPRPGRVHPGRVHLQRQAFSLFTSHPARVAAPPADLRPAAEKAGRDRVHVKDVDPAVADQVWQRIPAPLEPLHSGQRPARDRRRWGPLASESLRHRRRLKRGTPHLAKPHLNRAGPNGRAVSDQFESSAPT